MRMQLRNSPIYQFRVRIRIFLIRIQTPGIRVRIFRILIINANAKQGVNTRIMRILLFAFKHLYQLIYNLHCKASVPKFY